MEQVTMKDSLKPKEHLQMFCSYMGPKKKGTNETLATLS